MILTGKCKEEFKYWFDLNYLDFWNHYQNKNTLLNSIITEWFDSVGVFIHVKRNCTGIKFNHWYYIITDDRGMHMNNFLENKIDDDNRQEATNQAIIKANQIYNSL